MIKYIYFFNLSFRKLLLNIHNDCVCPKNLSLIQSSVGCFRDEAASLKLEQNVHRGEMQGSKMRRIPIYSYLTLSGRVVYGYKYIH